MRVFLTGANGWIGSAIGRDLLAAGHSVAGLVRSKEKGEELAALGVTPVVGALTDLDVIRDAAKDADGIIHTAFGLDFSEIEELAKEDREAIETYGEVFAGSDRPIVVTSGVGLADAGQVFDEDARPPVIPDFPRASEQTAFAIAERGARACVVRNPRSVHGQSENHGFVPMLATVARQKGVSAWVGDGQNLWPSVHRLDSARLYRLALEGGERGYCLSRHRRAGRSLSRHRRGDWTAAGHPRPIPFARRGRGAFRPARDVGGGERSGVKRPDPVEARLGAARGRPNRRHRAARLPSLNAPLAALAGGEVTSYGVAEPAYGQVDFGAQAAAEPTKDLILSPFFTSLACW